MTDAPASPAIPRYCHTQKAPLCLLIFALAVVFLTLGEDEALTAASTRVRNLRGVRERRSLRVELFCLCRLFFSKVGRWCRTCVLVPMSTAPPEIYFACIDSNQRDPRQPIARMHSATHPPHRQVTHRSSHRSNCMS